MTSIQMILFSWPCVFCCLQSLDTDWFIFCDYEISVDTVLHHRSLFRCRRWLMVSSPNSSFVCTYILLFVKHCVTSFLNCHCSMIKSEVQVANTYNHSFPSPSYSTKEKNACTSAFCNLPILSGYGPDPAGSSTWCWLSSALLINLGKSSLGWLIILLSTKC